MSDQAVIIGENLVNDQTASEMASSEIDAKLSQPTVPNTGQDNSQIVFYMGIMMATASLVLGKKTKKDRE
ncbi:LPXTG cell wall anchor domain-containing protein [Streptococcus penaeicida]